MHGPQILGSLKHMTTERMPQHMRMQMLIQPRFACLFGQPLLHGARPETLAALAGDLSS